MISDGSGWIGVRMETIMSRQKAVSEVLAIYDSGRNVRVTDKADGTAKAEDFDTWLGHTVDKDHIPDGLSLNDAKEIMHDYAMTFYGKKRESALSAARAKHDADGGGEDE